MGSPSRIDFVNARAADLSVAHAGLATDRHTARHASHLADSAPPDRAAAESLAVGEACYRAGNYAQAVRIFAHLAAIAPDDPTPMRLLGRCRLRLGDTEDALALLTRAADLAPADPYCQLHHGLALHAAGQHAQAADRFRDAARVLTEDPAPLLNLSAALLALGETSKALAAARRARRRAPQMPQAVYMVGLTLLALDRLADAEDEFAEAIRLDPRFADAWVNLGVVRYRRDDIARAKVAMRKALDIAPGHLAAAANLGVFLRLTGEPEASERWLRAALSRDPEAAEARLNLAAMLLGEERAGEALALLDERPAPTARRPAQHWQLQRALALLQSGRPHEARAAIALMGEAPPEVASLLSWRRLLLALTDGDVTGARRHAGEMEAALTTIGTIVPEHRIMGHFDLARFWSQQHEPDHAFAHWTAGHRLIGRFQPFSRDAHRRFVDATIARLDRARFADGPRVTNRDAAPVFIVGMPRSGTTLAEQIIASHPQAFGAGERGALSSAFAALGGGETPEAVARIAALDRGSLDAAAGGYLRDLHALAPGADRIVDKMPGNLNYLGLAALMLPGARIIYCARDPRDIGLSIFTYRFFGHHPYAHDLADLGWYIAEHRRLMAHWRDALPNPILTVALEDWVNDFDGTLRRVLGFLDLPYDESCARFYERDSRVMTVSRRQVRQPINAGGLGRWRAYEKHLQPLIAELERHGARVDDGTSSGAAPDGILTNAGAGVRAKGSAR